MDLARRRRSAERHQVPNRQRFFIAYGRAWATKMREETLRGRIATDGQAPGQYRAQTVRSLHPWYGAFDVKAGQMLFLKPESRVKVW
jgi:predicted metalloendopeptidase